ncbi:MAG: LamG domain-containing protein, partial [FCB group bacterium]|nr:LamG domain-containing protein [FCB group bacterium]
MYKISLFLILFSTVFSYQDCNNNPIGGNALAFDGIDDRIDVADSPLINNGTHAQRTVECWFKITDKSITSRKQVIYEEGGTTRGLNIYIFDNSLYVGGWNRPNNQSGWSGTFLSTAAINSGQWHHVALVLDGTAALLPDAIRGYLDGQLFGSGDGSQLWGHKGDIGVGCVDGKTRFHDSTSVGANGFEGLLEDIRVWNEARTQLQIEKNMYSEFSTIPANLVACWKLNSSSGLTAIDDSGNGNTGTLTNMAGTEWLPSTAPIPFVTVADGNWSSPSTWLSSTVPNSIGAMVTIGHAVTLDTDVTVANIELTSNAALTDTAYNLTLKGDWYSCGSCTETGGTTVFSGDAQQSVAG